MPNRAFRNYCLGYCRVIFGCRKYHERQKIVNIVLVTGHDERPYLNKDMMWKRQCLLPKTWNFQ